MSRIYKVVIFVLPFLLFLFLPFKSVYAVLEPTMVKDIYPGITPSNPSSLVSIGDTVYFAANDGVNGIELWKSNGTVDGTVIVKDIYAGALGSSPSNLTAVGPTLFFRADNGTSGIELWKSDGTSVGTVLVKDIYPGGNSSFPHYLTAVGTTLFFRANNGTSGIELWKSDGTSVGTVLVKDIYPGSTGSYPYLLTEMGDILYFTADNGTIEGKGLWKSNGTLDGTEIVYPLAEPQDILWPISGDNILYFSYLDDFGWEPWRTDGTESGTYMLKDVNEGNSDSYGTELSTTDGDNLYFIPYEIIDGSWIRTLWKSDGTKEGTKRIALTNSQSGDQPRPFKDFVYFDATTGATDNELWRINKNGEDLALVKDINVGSLGSYPYNIYTVGENFFFVADTELTGYELWKSNGTEVGTIIVKDINVGSGNSNPSKFTLVGSTLYFTANNGINGTELWKLDVDIHPPVGTVSINSGSQFTTSPSVSLLLNATDALSTVTSMIVCDNELFTDCNWEIYQTTKPWTFDNVLGTKTIYVKYKDSEDNESGIYTDSIILHTPSILITDIGLVRNIADKSPLTMYFTSQTPVIKGITQPSSTVYFVFGGNTYTSVADSNGNFTITLNVSRGNNTIQYYSKDVSNNQSETKTITLIVGTEYFPETLLERLGLLPVTEEETVDEETPQENLPPVIEDNDSQEQENTDNEIQTIQFLDKDGNPMVNALVQINGQEYFTDSNGEIQVYGLEEGKNYKVKIDYEGIRYEIEVLGEKETDGSVKISIREEDISKGIDIKKIGIYAGIALLFIFFLILILKKRKKEENNISYN